MPKQYIIQYPEGTVTDDKGNQISNADISHSLLQALQAGGSVSIPSNTGWTIQVVDLPNPTPTLKPKELTEEEFKAKFPECTPTDKKE